MGGGVAVLLVVITLLQVVVFMTVPPPTTISGWYALFQTSWLSGLLAYEVLMVVYVLVSIPLILALYQVLKPVDPSLMAIYLALSFVGILAFVEARPAFEMLALSREYAAASTDAERNLLLAAGHAVHGAFNGMAFQVSYVLGALGGMVVAIVMLKGQIFNKATPIVRIASSLLDFGLFVPVVGLFLSLGSVLCLLVWHVLIAIRLFQLASRPDFLAESPTP